MNDKEGAVVMAGRPREFDRDAALASARDLFWERGYEGVSMSDLTKRLGLASARIYAAFGSKEDLFREAIRHYESNEGGFVDRAFAEEPTVVGAIERAFRHGIELYTRGAGPRGCMVVLSAVNYAKGNGPLRDWLAGHRRRRTASIAKKIREGIDNGELPPELDADILGDLYATALHGIAIQAKDGVSRKRLLAFIPALLSLLEPYRGVNG
jgi:AcrR family transcriptional regulator